MFNVFVTNSKNETGIDPRVVAYYNPGSTIFEQYRNIRTYLNSINGGETFRSMIIASANRQEGKSITAVNLALAMAEEKEKKIVLVNADFRFPVIEKLLNTPAGLGLSEFLKGQAQLDNILTKTYFNNLTLVPAGEIPAHPAELLASQKMKDLIAELEKEFDYVLFDTPALIPFADARILAPCVDGVLLTVQAGKTRREVLWRTQEQIKNLHTKLLGVILTQVEYYIPEYIHRHL
ncbi:MAG: CpsD/CapB family tyrosine-protein kinase [Candidatus Omnitrophica bacterium]|nr:CpsD/CapB family tyrosine-protein kinase [Candidatus Omnitrophota bacterium]MBU4478291.1 CpsD/CapB family tyrosine-protein kinase [Candidatus Omnitrophota bacterium]MCG2703359.1 CpsD/CapB family tyrosine-protein kinase [Candidatus Omnitrophota bacterium]